MGAGIKAFLIVNNSFFIKEGSEKHDELIECLPSVIIEQSIKKISNTFIY